MNDLDELLEAGPQACKKPRSERSVQLDGEDSHAAPRQSRGERTETRADLHDEVAGDEFGLSYEALREAGTEKVLAELPTLLVSRCPPIRGHG